MYSTYRCLSHVVDTEIYMKYILRRSQLVVNFTLALGTVEAASF